MHSPYSQSKSCYHTRILSLPCTIKRQVINIKRKYKSRPSASSLFALGRFLHTHILKYEIKNSAISIPVSELVYGYTWISTGDPLSSWLPHLVPSLLLSARSFAKRRFVSIFFGSSIVSGRRVDSGDKCWEQVALCMDLHERCVEQCFTDGFVGGCGAGELTAVDQKRNLLKFLTYSIRWTRIERNSLF